jgi:serine/threonine-protein kinase
LPPARWSLPPPTSAPPPPPPSSQRAAALLANASAPVAPVGIDAVLHAEEVARARVFFRVIVAIATLVAVFTPALPGPMWLRGGAGALCAIAAVLGVVVLLVLRQEERYTAQLVTAVGVICAVIGVLVIYWIGLFSAGAMVLTLGIYFFGLSRSRAAAHATYATVATLYLISSASVAAGVLPDMSLFSIAGVSPLTRWFQVLMSQVMFAVTFYLARSSRLATERAVDQAQRQSLELRQREALLAEARVELDRALMPGEGRHSGRTVGAYRLGELLGRGGMGEVYRGRHEQTGQAVAVKLLHPNLVENADHVRRFMREAEAVGAVQTRHVPGVREVGVTPTGEPFMAMELLEGHDLGWHLRKSDRLELANVVELCEHVADALAAVRDAGVVHRDLKPANLFLTDTIPRTWKVLDFGLSKILWSGSSLTQEQAVGTPSYMAPEQIRGKDVDHLADLYALAAIAYRALTGRPPFSGDKIPQVLYDVLNAQPPHPAQLVRLPVDVELVLAIGMAKRPKDRFRRAEEFAAALRCASQGELDDDARAHGWALLRAQPWGSSRRR